MHTPISLSIKSKFYPTMKLLLIALIARLVAASPAHEARDPILEGCITAASAIPISPA
jgi:hypothetical protein